MKRGHEELLHEVALRQEIRSSEGLYLLHDRDLPLEVQSAARGQGQLPGKHIIQAHMAQLWQRLQVQLWQERLQVLTGQQQRLQAVQAQQRLLHALELDCAASRIS